ncbi:MAG: hypothetical protein EP329_08625, partial [Deltaproteobacteria bacterium]
MGSVVDWLRQHDIASIAPPAVFQRGRRYAEDGRCAELGVGTDGVLHAKVTGSSGGRYSVIAIAGGPRLVAKCDCPAGRTANCKHIVCALITLHAQLALQDATTAPARPEPSGAALRDAPQLGRLMSREQLYAWAKAHGVTHWLSISVAIVPHFVPEPHEAVVDFMRRRMLPIAEFFGSDSRWSHVPRRFVDDLVTFLRGRAERAAAWRAEDNARTWPAASHPALAHYVEELTALRRVLRAD